MANAVEEFLEGISGRGERRSRVPSSDGKPMQQDGVDRLSEIHTHFVFCGPSLRREDKFYDGLEIRMSGLTREEKRELALLVREGQIRSEDPDQIIVSYLVCKGLHPTDNCIASNGLNDADA